MLGEMPDQDAEVGYMVIRIASGQFISVPEFRIDEEEVIGYRQILLVMNNTGMIKWHHAEHAAISLKHTAFHGCIQTAYPSYFADNVARIGLDRLGEVIQPLVDKPSCVGTLVKNNRCTWGEISRPEPMSENTSR